MERHTRVATRARTEALQRTLGQDDPRELQERIRGAIGATDETVLIGGPPCQAYSLVGRSRNRGKANYVPENDHRQRLYVEYLQILADHCPAVFVMENVKGLRSASLDSHRLFDRILADLHAPAAALRREGRRTTGRGQAYVIHSLVPDQDLFGASNDFVVRAEQFGVPQARHRVILVGIRADITAQPGSLSRDPGPSLRAALSDLPRLRSAVSGGDGGSANWKNALNAISAKPWLRDLDDGVRRVIGRRLLQVVAPHHETGGNLLERNGSPPIGFTWASSNAVPFVLNHEARSHMATDLERYFFAACWAEKHGRSPSLADFPAGLLPAHRNVKRALDGALFADRFRVQMLDRPSTTITSHIAKDGHYFIHPDPRQCRSLTVREAARLQTFPDDYLFTGPRTSQYHQVGNAVPPHLARQIAGCVAEALGLV
jgi:DNA (cytosine-5)-methyltransferase 1